MTVKTPEPPPLPAEVDRLLRRLPWRIAPVRLGGHEGHEAGFVEGVVLPLGEFPKLGDAPLAAFVANHDHVPGLAVASVRGKPGAVQYVVKNGVRQRLVAELPCSRGGRHYLAKFHGPFCPSRASTAQSNQRQRR